MKNGFLTMAAGQKRRPEFGLAPKEVVPNDGATAVQDWQPNNNRILMRQRPMSVLIFGILNIAYGLFKLGMLALSAAMQSLGPKGNPVAAAMKADPAMAALTKFNMVIGVILGVALVLFGIGLLLSKNWARLGSIVYSVVDIVLVVVGTIIVWPITQRAMASMPNVPHGMVEGFAMIGMVIGLAIGLAYPALLLFFMTRTNVIEYCQGELQTVPEPLPPPA
jgi:hypothetical protein